GSETAPLCQPQRSSEVEPWYRRGARAGRLRQRARNAGRHQGSEARRHQRVHDRLQLLFVRLRHDRPSPRREVDRGGGDYDHIVSRGSLCVKGISMFATHASPNRLQKPLYRAPGSDHWEDISWQEAAEKVARRIKKVRDETWIATEKVGDKEVPVNRT